MTINEIGHCGAGHRIAGQSGQTQNLGRTASGTLPECGNTEWKPRMRRWSQRISAGAEAAASVAR